MRSGGRERWYNDIFSWLESGTDFWPAAWYVLLLFYLRSWWNDDYVDEWNPPNWSSAVSDNFMQCSPRYIIIIGVREPNKDKDTFKYRSASNYWPKLGICQRGEVCCRYDASLALTFTALSPCNLVRVVGRGVVVEKVGSSLGANSRSVIKIIIIQRSSKTQLTALSHIGWR